MAELTRTLKKVIRVTPTITGVTYANNDILFGTTEIPQAVFEDGAASKLVSCMINSKSNSVFDCEIFFCSVNQSVGAINAERNVSDSDWATAKVHASLTLDGSADDYNYGGGRVFRFDRNQEGFAETAGDDVAKGRLPLILQAAEDSTSVYCFAFLAGTDVTPDFSVGDLELIFGLEL